MTIVIPAYNEESYIWPCVEAVLQNWKWYIDQVIVVDNASTDKTAEIAKSFTNITVLSQKQKWVTKARQMWYEAATWDIIAFLDADTVMTRERVTEVYEIFEKQPEVWFLSWPYFFHDATKIQREWFKLYWWFSYFVMYICAWYFGVWWNMILRKETLKKMNWFDTSIVFYGDDTDTACRAKEFGKSLFLMHLSIPSSYRRFRWQWIFSTLYLYSRNALYVVLFKKPYSHSSKNFR